MFLPEKFYTFLRFDSLCPRFRKRLLLSHPKNLVSFAKSIVDTAVSSKLGVSKLGVFKLGVSKLQVSANGEHGLCNTAYCVTFSNVSHFIFNINFLSQGDNNDQII